jgi:hypothetical protein
MTTHITDGCEICRYAYYNQKSPNKPVLECRYMPPQLNFIPVPNRLTGGLDMQIISSYPVVAHDMKCSKYAASETH